MDSDFESPFTIARPGIFPAPVCGGGKELACEHGELATLGWGYAPTPESSGRAARSQPSDPPPQTGAGNLSTQFRVVCSPGTYVRSLARDIAALCGTVATVDMIRRVRTNGFDIKDTVTLDFLENLYHNDPQAAGEYLRPIDFGLGDIPVWNLNSQDAERFKNGGFIESAVCSLQSADINLARIYQGDKFLGIGIVETGILKPKRVITS